MGIFDGILICSDWDGTLAVGSHVPENNINSIRRFQNEGGKFTVCTGRFYPYIDGFSDKVKPNTHLISLNGACIVDENSREKLYEGFLPKGALELVEEALAINSSFVQIYFFIEGVDEALTLSVKDYFEAKNEILGKRLYKIVLVASSAEDAIFMRDYVNAAANDLIISMRSWHTGVEILSTECTKGSAVLRLKEMIGAKTLVCVGDFENDASMLSVADVSYAVEGAIDVAALAADKVCARVEHGAVASVIDDLERTILSAKIKDID